MKPCDCPEHHVPRRIVLTGGPGAGKSAVLELVRQSFCTGVIVLPEAAGIIFGGGFPRDVSTTTRRAAQRAIFFVQHELEAYADGSKPALVLCDRGSLDSLAYWPGPDDFWTSVRTTQADEIARYHAVIHLRTPTDGLGYNHSNPLRIESALEAAEIDARIEAAWANHPKRFTVPAHEDFLVKAGAALGILQQELPGCCAGH